MFGADDTALGTAFAVDPGHNQWQNSPTVITLADGGFVIGWSVFEQGVSHEVFAQRYDAAGQPVDDPIAIATVANGDDTLIGGVGTDSMSGGLGNDWFYVNTD